MIAYVEEHGIADLSFRPLAAAVGVSHVTLRHHFGSKEELVAEILDAVRRRQPLPDGPLEPADVEALLRSLWAGWTTEAGRNHYRLLFEAYGQALMHPGRYRTFLDHVVEDWLAVIGGFATGLGCPPQEAPAFATFVLAQVRGLQLDLLAGGDRGRVDAALDLLAAFAADRVAAWRAAGSVARR